MSKLISARAWARSGKVSASEKIRRRKAKRVRVVKAAPGFKGKGKG